MNDNFSCLGPRYKNISQKTLKQSNINYKIGYVKAISGAAMFFNTKKFDFIGGFDQNIFLYFEETDYCKRGSNVSLKAYQLNNVKITHQVGTAVEYEDNKEKEEIKKLCNWHFIWSKYYYYKKMYGLTLAFLYFIPIIIRINFRIFIYSLFKNDKKFIKYYIRWHALKESIKNKKSYMRLELIKKII